MTHLNKQDHSYTLRDYEMKERFGELKQENERLRKEMRNAKVRERRAKSTVNDILEQLAEKNLMNAELEQKLFTYKGNSTKLNFKL